MIRIKIYNYLIKYLKMAVANLHLILIKENYPKKIIAIIGINTPISAE
jgi:hypothetical protein